MARMVNAGYWRTPTPSRTAAVCKRGEVVTRTVIDPANRRMLDGNSIQPVPQWCGTCGARVITTCEHCGSPIPNPEVLKKVYEPNAFCVGCGEAFPWASREQIIRKLVALLDSEGDDLTDSQRLDLREAIEMLSVPATQPEAVKLHTRAATQLKTLAPKAWAAAQPYIRIALSEEVQQAVRHVH